MNYPECLLIDVDQRTPEWFAARRGRLTASNFGAWLTKDDKTSQKARRTAAAGVLADLAGFPDPPVYVSADIQRGIDWEPQAIQEFSRLTGLLVDPIGFAQSKHGLFGASPDGLILSCGEGLEIKCPRASKLIQYHQAGELPDEYRDQVHGTMAVLGCKSYHFFAYHEGLPSFHVRVVRDNYTNEILEGLKSFSNYLQTVSAMMTHLSTIQGIGSSEGGDQSFNDPRNRIIGRRRPMKWEREFMSEEDREEIERDADQRRERSIDRGDYLRDEMIDRQMEERESRKPQDGRICQCEDAPCCGCYDL